MAFHAGGLASGAKRSPALPLGVRVSYANKTAIGELMELEMWWGKFYVATWNCFFKYLFLLYLRR
jgi:hypothetical protein